MLNSFKKNITFFLLLTVYVNLNGQLLIKHTDTETLVNKNFLGLKPNLLVTSISYKGYSKSIASFVAGTQYLFVKSGIILSTGIAANADGPNQSNCTGSKLGTVGYQPLSLLANNTTYDAAVLTISFIATTNQVSFNYIFASDEYPEYVNKGVNDVFAFFISGPGYKQPKNIALIPDTDIAVSVDGVNHLTNSKYYIDNKFWDTNNLTALKKNEVEAERAYSFGFDGFTTLFTAKANVQPYNNYTITIAISDVGDSDYDSAVLLQKGSFTSNGTPANAVTLFTNNINMLGNDISFDSTKTDTVRFEKAINFATNSVIPVDTSLIFINNLTNLLKKYFTLNMVITGHTDNVGTAQYNMELSLKRAESIKQIIVENGIIQNRIITKGMGHTKATSTNKTLTGKSLNRRVEFTIY